MFGLDARIALAIFGALSVITGASLYSALNKTKATTVLSDLENMGKAFEQYFLDVRKLPTLNVFHYNMVELTESAEKGWRGSYLQYPKYDSFYLKYDKLPGSIMCLTRAKISDFTTTSGTDDWPLVCSDDDDCTLSVYISVPIATNSNIEKLATNIDNLVDEGDGPAKGKFRTYKVTSTNKLLIRYQIAPVKAFK